MRVKTYLNTGDILPEGYVVGKPLALGGYAVVYAGERLWDDFPVVIKCPRHDATQMDPATFERFEREAKAATQLQHPNVVRMLAFGRVEGGPPYIVMERLYGLALAQIMYKERMVPERVLKFLLQILSALETAHQAGLVHRDLKPANIFVCTDKPDALTGDERVKLLDFGLVKLLGGNDPVFARQLTMTNAPVGTPGYMAPEMIGEGTVTPGADLYAAGIVAYELLTGKQAFEGSSRQEVLRAQMRTLPEEPTRRIIKLPLYRVVDKLMAPEPSLRYTTASEALADLNTISTTWAMSFRARFFPRRKT